MPVTDMRRDGICAVGMVLSAGSSVPVSAVAGFMAIWNVEFFNINNGLLALLPVKE